MSRDLPEILPVRQNADPLLSVFQPARSGRLTSVTTSSSILLQSIPHLFKLAQYALVIHVALEPAGFPDYADITSIRQSGFTFLQSQSLQESQDLALSAHALAIKSGKGVIHFFDSHILNQDKPISQENRGLVREVLDMGVARTLQHATSDEKGIYADDGRQSKVYEPQRSGSADDTSPKHDNVSDGTKTPSNPQSSTTSSGSSVRSQSQSSGASSDHASSNATSVESLASRPTSSSDILSYVTKIWAEIASATGRQYSSFQYTGPQNAEEAVFVFGADGGLFSQAMEAAARSSEAYGKAGLLTATLIRPWLGEQLAATLPKTIKKIAVLEQVRRKTTRWGPLLLDLLMSLKSGDRDAPQVVGYQLRHIELATVHQALRGVFQNLLQDKPLQNLEVGNADIPQAMHILPTQQDQPQLENAYMKVLDQIFGQRLYVANQLMSQNAGISATIKSNPEYGFGSLMARTEHRKRFVQEVSAAAKSQSFATEDPAKWLSKWVLNSKDPQKSNAIVDDVIARLQTDGSALASRLLATKGLFRRESNWLIGSDAWAYDLGNSGVHHVIASGENVNMLIIDSQPYSERAAADAVRRKKDIGLYAMNFGNAYVASVAVYASYTQVLQAMIEADQFDGPSVVVAYLPYNKENDSPLTVLQETKKAVDLGYWPLYRWNPKAEEKGEESFHLDSERIRQELEEFLRRDNYMSQLMRRHPEFSANLASSYGSEVRDMQKRKAKDAYAKLLEGLFGAPMTVLFASDNGNAENLAKRLANRGKARGLKSMAIAMDEYPLDDLSSEENIVMITSTAGQGEFPQNGRAFWEGVKNSTEIDLANIRFAVFALGDRHYWPRKEDKIYYNKPGKDLYARILALGAKPLVEECGMGDDQDPDGYHTGYNEFEPKLWTALGVDKVEGVPEEPPPLTNEDIKIQSNYLRGTIAEGLKDPSTGAISAADQQLTKFHGTYMQDDRDLRDERKAQGLEPAYAFMIRCRLPGGVATPSQWLQMDDISTNLGNETMKLTTRQTFQFHGVVKGKLRPAMQAINKALMTTIAACGDVNRNVMCSSLPEHSQLHADVHAVCKKISDHLLPSTTAYHEIWLKDENNEKTQIAGDAVVDHEPLYGPTYLPRKFKITIAIPPHNDTDVYAHDIGLIAIKDDKGRLEGFNVLAGGGMGVTHNNKKTYPRTGSMLGYVPASETHIACEKIMFVQRDHGDRKNRKHARLKYTMDDMGHDVFRSKVEEIWGAKFAEPKPFHFDSNIDTFGWVKDENGLNHFTMFIENGRIEDTATFPMKTGLREIAKLQKGEFRLTGNQHLILSRVHDSDMAQIKELLAKYKLDNTNFSALRLSSSACVAFPTCGLAMAESERYLPELITKLEGTIEEEGLRQDSIVMRVTGCPNGCARPWLAEIGLVGKAYVSEAQSMNSSIIVVTTFRIQLTLTIQGAYNLYLGGGYHGNRLNKLYRSSIKEEEILSILKPLFKQYALERSDGERFGDFVIRKGVIKATTEGKTFHDDTAEMEDEE